MPKERKYLLIAGTILLLLGAVYRFYPDLAAYFGGSNESALQMRQLSRYRQAAAERPRLQAQHTALQSRLERAEQILLGAPTPSLGAVDIQNVINDIAYANNLVVESVRVQRTKDAPVEGFLEVPVTVTIKLRIRQLTDLLHRIEAAPQLLAVTDMNLRAAPAGEPDTLNAVITVSGYMPKPENESQSQQRRGASPPPRR
ncbi:type II secretion system protein GspM [Desulfatitalea alkaliphila]|uniref:Type II secretion system protein GspM n=1 Tax=Desulfatitalea alkaliphila TaxID=2929485 RepID=A0AA41UI94_9BACT|nr:type II secretion system protein GspM [Desulfatitalea alkaliphila]MCJ8499377.1 type II secretion system protein GspM [Desulfatitalea alkaliphila]